MKNKYLFGGIIIVVFIGLMGYLVTQSSIKYENNINKIKTENKTVKATGQWVREKDYIYNLKNRMFTFYMKDEQGNQMKVVYNGAIPNNFKSAQSLVVSGKYQNGYFKANSILTKCPSKYEGQKIQSSGI
ncbi:MAG: cytochrome c maturation protein CcmE [Bacteroidetes bacterium]|nr:cytochrome c maturation protein CcmE [Bacteroidota bacterium]MCH8942682.1 cytochrome c maturation protein CcmE [Bacteroidota bacterium]